LIIIFFKDDVRCGLGIRGGGKIPILKETQAANWIQIACTAAGQRGGFYTHSPGIAADRGIVAFMMLLGSLSDHLSLRKKRFMQARHLSQKKQGLPGSHARMGAFVKTTMQRIQ